MGYTVGNAAQPADTELVKRLSRGSVFPMYWQLQPGYLDVRAQLKCYYTLTMMLLFLPPEASACEHVQREASLY